MLYYMIKLDFVITCLGLFLIIIVALIIGNANTTEGFEFIGDFNTKMTILKSNMNEINKYLTAADIEESKKMWKKIEEHTYVNNQTSIPSTNINYDEENDFLLALNNFQTQIYSIPNINKPTLKEFQQKNLIIVNEINDIVMDNMNNHNLPIELRKLLGKIWWNCTKIQQLISDNKLASDFKNAYKSVTYYITDRAFIMESSDIANTQNSYTKIQYLSFIKILREKLNLVYQNDKKAMSESDKQILDFDLANLESYMNTGKFIK